MPKSDNYTIGTGYWMGKPTTDEHGAFSGRRFDTPSSDKAWLIAYHPTEGVQRARLQDWASGGTMKLDRWNTVHGTLTDRDGKAVSGAKVEFSEIEFERNADDNFAGSLIHTASTTTDELGHYKLDQILPRSKDSMIRVNGTFVSARGFPLGAGETRLLDIRLRPNRRLWRRCRRSTFERSAPESSCRRAARRRDDKYEIGVTVEMEGTRRFERLTPE